MAIEGSASHVWVAGAVLRASRKGDVFLAWGFGMLLCVNCVWGRCANRRCENVALVSVAVPIEGMKILR